MESEIIEETKALVKNFFALCEHPKEQDLLNWLMINNWRFARMYDHSCHTDDVICILTDWGYKVNEIPSSLIEEIVYEYEKSILNYGSESGWRDLLNSTIEDFGESLKPYEKEEE